MSTQEIVLDDEVLDALRRSYIYENSLVLPRPMDRRIYDKANKVLNLLGGVWNKSKKAHIFQEDAEPVVSDAIAAGVVVDLRTAYQFFETPDHTADRFVQMADPKPGDRASEPSAGRGRIALALRRAGVEPEVCEKWDKNREVLVSQGFQVVAEDFLGYNPGPVYDVIVANPPYTRGQDMAHVTHMWELLAPGGRLVSAMSPAWTFRKTKQAEEFRRLIEEVGGVWTPLDESAFAGNGAGARTGVILLRKPGTKQEPVPEPVAEEPEPETAEEIKLDDGEAVDLDRIKLRIAKMLALGDQEKSKTTQAEAELALSRAQALMAKYNITREQAIAAQDQTVIEEKWILKRVLETRSRPLEILYVMQVITGHFLVEMFETRTFPTSQFTWARAYSIYGRESNVEVAEYILQYLRPVFRELWGAYRGELLAAGYASHEITRREIRTYFRGLASGLSARLYKERDRLGEDTCTALVRIAEDAREKAKEEFDLTYIKHKDEGGSSASFSRGYDDAKKVSLRPGIKGKDAEKLGDGRKRLKAGKQ